MNEKKTLQKLNKYFDKFLKDEKKVFDENYFHFRIRGGPIHTEILIAEAIIKDGINKYILCHLL